LHRAENPKFQIEIEEKTGPGNFCQEPTGVEGLGSWPPGCQKERVGKKTAGSPLAFSEESNKLVPEHGPRLRKDASKERKLLFMGKGGKQPGPVEETKVKGGSPAEREPGTIC